MHAKTIFITATNTDVGKTHTACKLIKRLSKKGYRVGAYKPIETGVRKTPEDAKRLLKAVQKHSGIFLDRKPNDIVSYTFGLPASPFVAKGAKHISIATIVEDMKRLQRECDILIIEGAGGLMVPIEKEVFMYDLLCFLDALPLLVTSSRLGSINDTMLSLDKLGEDTLWCVNLHQDADSFAQVTKPFYDSYFTNYYILPKDLDSLCEGILERL